MNLYTYVETKFFKLMAVDHRKLPRYSGFLFSRFKLVVFAVRKFHLDRGFQRSSALAYSMLLSILPMMVIMVLAVSALGGKDTFKSYIESTVQGALPPDSSKEVSSWLVNQSVTMVNNFQAAISSHVAFYVILSFLIFLVAVIFFFDTIEGNLNDLWGAKKTRSPISRFKNFWCLITIGPILLFLSYYISFALDVDTFLARTVAFILPYLLVTAGLFFLYLFMPSASIRVDSAFWGALAAAVLWVILKDQSNAVASAAFKKEAYNYLWIIPVFLVWVYFTWVVVLIGMEIVICSQNFDFIDSGYIGRELGEGFSREYIAAGLAVAACEAFLKGERPPEFKDVAKRFRVPEHNLFDVALDLERANIVERTDAGALLFRPCRPPEQITVADVVKAVRGESFSVPLNIKGAFADRMREIFISARSATDDRLHAVTIKDLVDSNPGGKSA
jgi:membrane protein